MARAIVTLQIMPDSPNDDLKRIETCALAEIKKFAGDGETKITIEPVAFGLSAINIIFVMNEDIGSTEPLEESVAKIQGVSSVLVTDVRRAVG